MPIDQKSIKSKLLNERRKETWSWDRLRQTPWSGWAIDEHEQPYPLPSGADAEIDGHRPATLQDFWRDEESKLIPRNQNKYTRVHSSAERRPIEERTYAADRIIQRFEFMLRMRHKYPDVDESAFKLPLQGIQVWDLNLQALGAATLPGFDAEGATFFGETVLSGLNFEGAVNLSQCVFFDALVASDCTFSDSVHFDSSTFLDTLDLEKSVFRTQLKLCDAKVLGTGIFKSLSSHYTDASRVVFGEPAYFMDSIFSQSFRFGGTICQSTINFESCVFFNHADFSDAVFLSGVVLRKAAFARNAKFREVAFLGDSIFDEAKFVGRSDFSGASRWRPAFSSNDALRIKDHDFVRSSFPEFFGTDETLWGARGSFVSLYLRKAFFFSVCGFENRDFPQRVLFSETTFSGPAMFSDSQFIESAHFREARFLKPGITSKEWESLCRVAMRNIEEEFNTAAERLKKHDVPLDTLSDGISDSMFNRRKKEIGEHTEVAALFEDGFRILRRHMEAKRDHSEAHRFYRLELEARRFRTDGSVSWLEKQVSRCYGFVSDYGTSIWRPLAFLLLITLLFAIHYSAASVAPSESFEQTNAIQGLGYSLSRVLPFAELGSLPTNCSPLSEATVSTEEFFKACGKVATDDDGTRGPAFKIVFGLITSLQSILSLISLFLIGLAVRRKFQINQ